ncbi:DUF4177 domain-containing protein [Luteolibacter flavescens]|uniref:DUF4177 domain-containing protein n=1 Tax=Luteolibacter flavescens TaxID=1859460 RepID=A0ABT3FKB3_9BACT|nr:DUF4177 domain-containing protein [Luteolibacter flavescens]MCW1883996.1 DUF4177 domain-containing protein [Luteolibacter flavescens]
MKEYKVISQNDKWFSGRFDPAKLQKLLNEQARQGWVVKSMCSASREGVLLGGNKDEMIILLERDLPTEATATAATKKASQGPSSPYPSQPEHGDAARRRAELDKILALIEESDWDPLEKRRQKLKAIADYS